MTGTRIVQPGISPPLMLDLPVGPAGRQHLRTFRIRVDDRGGYKALLIMGHAPSGKPLACQTLYFNVNDLDNLVTTMRYAVAGPLERLVIEAGDVPFTTVVKGALIP